MAYFGNKAQKLDHLRALEMGNFCATLPFESFLDFLVQMRFLELGTLKNSGSYQCKLFLLEKIIWIFHCLSIARLSIEKRFVRLSDFWTWKLFCHFEKW